MFVLIMNTINQKYIIYIHNLTYIEFNIKSLCLICQLPIVLETLHLLIHRAVYKNSFHQAPLVHFLKDHINLNLLHRLNKHCYVFLLNLLSNKLFIYLKVANHP